MATFDKVYSYPVLYKCVVPSGTSGTETLALKTVLLPTDDFEFVCQVRRSNVPVAGISSAYNKATGVLTVGTSLAYQDVIEVIGCWTN